MSRSPEDASHHLAAVLSAQPPPSLAGVDPSAIVHLADAVRAESRRQAEAIGQAVDDALRLVPRPLRRIVKRVLHA